MLLRNSTRLNVESSTQGNLKTLFKVVTPSKKKDKLRKSKACNQIKLKEKELMLEMKVGNLKF